MNPQKVDIILVEDNPHEAMLAIRSLKKHHLANNLIHLDDGEQAMNFIFSEGEYSSNINPPSPKLILLDINLPKINGLDILRRVKADPRTQKIPIVLLTSSREESDIMESYKLGANSYIVKPVDFNSFSQAIQEMGMYWLVLNEPPNL
jgi:two-component system response regulator